MTSPNSNHLKPITPLDIETIRAWEWCGNAWSDGPAFESINEFVADESKSIAERAEALYLMGKNGMGLDDSEMGLTGPAGTSPEEDARSVAEHLESIDPYNAHHQGA